MHRVLTLSCARQTVRRKWLPLELNQRVPVLQSLVAKNNGEHFYFVLPGGLFLKLASNPNNFDVLLEFSATPLTGNKPVAVVIPRNSAV